MKNTIRKTILTVGLLAALLLTGCGQKEKADDELARIQEAGVLKVGVEVEFVEAEWDSLLAAIDSGRIDTVINAVSITSERQKKYDFTSPYVSLYRNIIVKGDNDTIKSLEDLNGTNCAENITTEYADRLEELGATIVPIDTLQQAFDLITPGRADFTILEDIQFYPYLKEHPDADLKIAFTIDDDVDQFAIPFKKGETRLVEEVKQVIAEHIASGNKITNVKKEPCCIISSLFGRWR